MFVVPFAMLYLRRTPRLYNHWWSGAWDNTVSFILSSKEKIDLATLIQVEVLALPIKRHREERDEWDTVRPLLQ